MHTVEFIVAGVFAAGVVIALVAHFGFGISTQHRDHGVAAEGSLPRRRTWSREHSQPHAGPVNAEAIPSESVPGQQHSDVSAGITDDQA